MAHRSITRLRAEAQYLGSDLLSDGQCEAAERLLALLDDAIHESTESPEASRYNRVLLLEGHRGCGKSSLIHTLRSWMDPENPDQQILADLLRERRARRASTAVHVAETRGQRLKSQALDRIQTVDWLEPLRLDPLFPGTNLLAAALARIEKIATRLLSRDERYNRQGMLEPVSRVDRALHELDNLRRHAITGLEGNLEDARKTLPPENYANTANDNETQKLELKAKLNKILGEIRAGSSRNSEDVQGIYVLTIEDIDMRPSRAAEVLRLAYEIAVPRLVVLLVGTVDVLDRSLRFKYLNEISGLTGPADDETKRLNAELSNELSSSALGKMLPLSHRIQLGDMKPAEAWRFRRPRGREADGVPDGENERELRQTVLEFDARAGDSRLIHIPADWGKLSWLLLRPYYSGSRVLSAPSRSVADFARLLEECVDEASRAEAEEEDVRRGAQKRVFTEKLVQAFHSFVDEDGALGQRGQDLFKDAVRGRGAAVMGIAPWPDCKLRLRRSNAIATPFQNKLAPVRVSAHYEAVELYRVGGESLQLHPRGVPVFALLHDMIRMGLAAGEISDVLRCEGMSELARTRWTTGLGQAFEVPWFSTQWPTFLHVDKFCQEWNRGVQENRTIADEKSEISGSALADHAILAAIRALLRTALLEPGTDEISEQEQATRIEKLKKKEGEKAEKEKGTALTEQRKREIDERIKADLKKEQAARNESDARSQIASLQGGKWNWNRDEQGTLCDIGGLAGMLETLLKRWLARKEASEDDLRTELYGDVLCDVICLLVPEVRPFPLPWDKDRLSANATFMTLARTVGEVLAEGETVKEISNLRKLEMRVRARRIERLANALSGSNVMAIFHAFGILSIGAKGELRLTEKSCTQTYFAKRLVDDIACERGDATELDKTLAPDATARLAWLSTCFESVTDECRADIKAVMDDLKNVVVDEDPVRRAQVDEKRKQREEADEAELRKAELRKAKPPAAEAQSQAGAEPSHDQPAAPPGAPTP